MPSSARSRTKRLTQVPGIQTGHVPTDRGLNSVRDALNEVLRRPEVPPAVDSSLDAILLRLDGLELITGTVDVLVQTIISDATFNTYVSNTINAAIAGIPPTVAAASQSITNADTVAIPSATALVNVVTLTTTGAGGIFSSTPEIAAGGFIGQMLVLIGATATAPTFRDRTVHASSGVVTTTAANQSLGLNDTLSWQWLTHASAGAQWVQVATLVAHT